MKKQSHYMHEFTAIFEEDADIGGFTVTIPALPGCISEGDTFEEASENIQEAASLYLKQEIKPRSKKCLFQRKFVHGQTSPLSFLTTAKTCVQAPFVTSLSKAV